MSIGLFELVILLIVGGYVLLHNQSFHRYVLRVAQEKATAAVGTRVDVRDFALHFRGVSPRLDLYNVVVHGAPPTLWIADAVKESEAAVCIRLDVSPPPPPPCLWFSLGKVRARLSTGQRRI